MAVALFFFSALFRRKCWSRRRQATIKRRVSVLPAHCERTQAVHFPFARTTVQLYQRSSASISGFGFFVFLRGKRVRSMGGFSSLDFQAGLD